MRCMSEKLRCAAMDMDILSSTPLPHCTLTIRNRSHRTEFEPAVVAMGETVSRRMFATIRWWQRRGGMCSAATARSISAGLHKTIQTWQPHLFQWCCGDGWRLLALSMPQLEPDGSSSSSMSILAAGGAAVFALNFLVILVQIWNRWPSTEYCPFQRMACSRFA